MLRIGEYGPELRLLLKGLNERQFAIRLDYPKSDLKMG